MKQKRFKALKFAPTQIEKRQKNRIKVLELCLQAFIDRYPDREWEGVLHEHGCAGVNHRLEDRLDPIRYCDCGGDYDTEQIKKVLRIRK